MTVRRDDRRKPMVGWYNPWRLLTTGLQVLVWEFVGQGRPMEEAPRSRRIRRFGIDEVWFDYAADLGDGWNPTFAIASLIAQPSLDVAGRTLPHGAFLLLGGDQVYPMPTDEEYRDRFVAPYRTALPDGERALFALPGNHDWYDGLVSFSRLFTQGRAIGGWRTEQAQSYFALALPRRWWLWAMDVRAGTRMDYGQRTYFADAARHLAKGDRVILVAAEPDWVTRERDERDDSHFALIEEELIAPREARVHVWLAGDRHHYRRHELRTPSGMTETSFQRITSGGGGAFLFPTHRPFRRNVVVRRTVRMDGKPVVQEQEFVQMAKFPSGVTSFRLSWLNLLFAVKNWKLGLFPMGVLYWALTGLALPAGWPATTTWTALLGSPGIVFWIVVVLVGFVIFADPTRWWFRLFGGLAHGLAHIATALVVTGIVSASFLTGAVTVSDQIAAHVLNFIAGAVFGPTLIGLYLFLSLNLFGFHPLEAFSSLRIQDYKHFLRFHVDGQGRLEIFPIAIRRVPRGTTGRGRYMLIEDPVVVDPSSPADPDREPAVALHAPA